MDRLEEVREILQKNFKTDNTDDLDISCETEEEFNNRVSREICSLFEPQPDKIDITTPEGCQEYVNGIEEAHERAENSTLHFGGNPDESRLLEDEELEELGYAEYLSGDLSPRDLLETVAKAQDIKTREVTIKEMGEWLKYTRNYPTRIDLEYLEKGVIPE